MADADRLGAIADIGREGDGAEALAADTGGFSVREHERLRRRHRPHRPRVRELLPARLRAAPRARPKASSTRSRCGCAARAWWCARARATTTRAGPSPRRATASDAPRERSDPASAARARFSRPPGRRPPAHEHVRAGAVGGRPGTGRDRGRRGRGQDRLRGGHRQRGARHPPRHRRPEGRGSRARGPPGRAAAARPGAFARNPSGTRSCATSRSRRGATRPSSW